MAPEHALLAAALLALSARGAPAAAQPDPGRYRELIEEAVSEFELSHFPEARALFRSAHEIQPSARTLRGIGMASFEMRDYVDAYHALSQSLSSPVRPLDEATRGPVADLLQRTMRFVALYRVRVPPGAGPVLVDGAEARTLPDGRVIVAIGDHEVTAGPPGPDAARAVVRVEGGEDAELALERAPAPVESPPLAAPRAVRATPPARSSPSGDPVAAGVLFGAAGLAIAGSLAVGLASWMTREEEIDRCAHPPPMFECDNADTLDAERDGAAAATVLLGAAGVAAAVTAIVLLVEDPSEDGAVACGPLGLGLSCRGAF